MPVLPNRRQQPNPVTPQVPIPSAFPAIPDEVLERFPSAKDWQTRLNEFWGRTNQALQEAQRQTASQVNSQVIWTVDRFLIYTGNNGAMPMFALDDTGIRLGNVLVINTPGRKVYIGAGNYANDNTPFYIDTLGRFSLGANLTWDPDTDTLAVTGIITATSGTIGGFDIGADYIRDTANSFGLASTVTGVADVRFWAGDTFANRATAPVRIKENGDAHIKRLLSESIELTGNFVSAAPSAIYLGTNVYSSGGRANGIEILGNYVAEANTTILRGIYVIPALAKNAWTGLSAFGVSIILNSASGAGTIDNAYGIYVDTVNVGTNNYAIYTTAAAGQCVFLGGINSTPIGATTPGTGAFTTLGATGLLDISASGAGQIKFPATQNPSANANTLDDYEEGTWTPAVGGSATYTTQDATYTKIGRFVTVHCRLAINSIGTGSATTITGLPFSSAVITAGAVGFFASAAASFVFVGCYINGSSILLTGLTAAATGVTNPASVLGNGTDIMLTVSYYV